MIRYTQITLLLLLLLIALKTVHVKCTWKRFLDAKNGLQESIREQISVDDQYPLDPLTISEMKQTRDLIESEKGNDYLFHLIELKEPLKSQLVPYFLQNQDPPPNSIPRKAFTILKKKLENKVYEAVVNLNFNAIESFEEITDVRISVTYERQMKVSEIVLEDPEVKKRINEAGWTDLSLINTGNWPIWDIANYPEWKGKRIVQVWFRGSNFHGDNYYAHPFDFVVLVDMDAEKVVQIIEEPIHDNFDSSNKTGNTVPRKEANYNYKLRGGTKFLRKDDKPIKMTSPEGPSFTMKGYQVQWQKWTMRVGFNRREGLILHTVSYNDSGKVRPVIYRASVVELFVPYGDPRSPFHRQMYYDEGFAGIGLCADQLIQDQDVIGTSKFIDGLLNNSTGDPIIYKDIISIHEEDVGILWKHVDFRTGEGVVVRSHRLAMSLIATVGNYEYIFNWYFYQDGSIMVEAQMTGIVQLSMMAIGATPTAYGTIVAPQLNSIYHQHFFTLRLDMDVDGHQNSAHTLEAVALPGPPGNPYQQGFTSKYTPLVTPLSARSNISPKTGLSWVVTNDNILNPYTNEPVGWKLLHANSPPLLMKEDSPIRRQAGYMEYDTWVTRYKEGQIYPSGNYVYTNDTGLPQWVNEDKDASLLNEDIVLWHTFGMAHIPRAKDYPVMPVASTGIWIKPTNFFLENPGLDVPPLKSK